MTPQDWNIALKPEVSVIEANKFIATIVRAHLTHNVMLDGDMVSTTTLVEVLYPLAYAKHSEEGMAARTRIFKALTWRALAKYDLKDCVTPGVKQRVGTLKIEGVPCLWHAPKTLPLWNSTLTGYNIGDRVMAPNGQVWECVEP